MRQVFLDIETTGLDVDAGNRVVEIAFVEVISNQKTGRVLNRRINPPERMIEPGVEMVLRMTWESLKHEPVFAEIASVFVHASLHLGDFDATIPTQFVGYLRGRRNHTRPRSCWLASPHAGRRLGISGHKWSRFAFNRLP